MIEIVKKIFAGLKVLLLGVIILTFILFVYAAFFYDTPEVNVNIDKETISDTDQTSDSNSKENLENDSQQAVEPERIENTEDNNDSITEETIGVPEVINDGLFLVVGNTPVTKSDIVNELKLILILNNLSYSEEIREELQQMAVKSSIKRNVKEIAIKKYNFLTFDKTDYNSELARLASKLNVDVDTLKNICISNGLDFSIIENQVKTELLWNSLIFYLYKDRISVNLDEVDEQLKLNKNKGDYNEYLISEIVLPLMQPDDLAPAIEEIKKKIELNGFETVAINLSISQTAVNGGDLGWVNENEISKKFREIIGKTAIGSLSEVIKINEGLLIFKVRDKRIVKNEMSLEELKNQLVIAEKTKILNMYQMSHYDSLRRGVAVKFFNQLDVANE